MKELSVLCDRPFCSWLLFVCYTMYFKFQYFQLMQGGKAAYTRQTKVGKLLCERHKNSRQTSWQTVGDK